MPRRSLPGVALALCLALAAGCSGASRWQAGLPTARADFVIERADPRGPFIDVRVVGGGIQRRLFARATPVCREMLRPEAAVELRRTQGFGPFVSGDRECPVVGIGDLERFRGSRTRGGVGRSPIRRGNDRIQIVYRDEEYLYARGGFSIGAMFGWAPGTDQVVALLPRTEVCLPLEQGGSVGVLFRQVGSPALGIVAGSATCPVHGLIAVERDDFQQPVE